MVLEFLKYQECFGRCASSQVLKQIQAFATNIVLANSDSHFPKLEGILENTQLIFR